MWRLLLKTANVYVSVHLHVVSSKKATNVHVSVHLHVVSSKKVTNVHVSVRLHVVSSKKSNTCTCKRTFTYSVF
jgi:hypothetical protein